MKLTQAQTTELQNRIAFAFHARATATMNTAGQIGQTNFYGDAANPTVTQADVLGIIECALDNWTQPEGFTADAWLDQVSSEILADVIASEPTTTTMKTIANITIRYNGNGITADGMHQNAETISPAEAIAKADAWAASDRGHIDFIGGHYDVWTNYDDGDSEHIHSTPIITA